MSGSTLFDLLSPAAASGAENPYDQMDLDQLVKIASARQNASDVTKVAAAQASPAQEEAGDPLSFLDEIGGKIMAHAMYNELTEIKVKTASQVCRVCKENAHDVLGSSVCAACLQAAEAEVAANGGV